MIQILAYLQTNGCKSAETDTGLAAALLSEDFEITENLSDADLIVLNLCGVTAYAGDKSVELYQEIEAQRKQDSTIIVTGCATSIDDDLTLMMPNAHHIPINEFNKLMHCLSEQTVVPTHQDGERLEVKVENGCAGACTYCAIPNARGSLRSYSISEISEVIEEFAQSHDNPVIDLVGEDVGAYGLDMGSNIVELLTELQDPNYALHVDVIHPWWFLRFSNLSEVLADGMNSGRIIPYLGLPLQSGSNSILKKMKRNYTVEQYQEIVTDLKERIPELQLSTDILVGFPGETDEDFQATLDFVRENTFDLYGIWQYSDRPNTAAMDYTDKIDETEVNQRIAKLYDLLQSVNPSAEIVTNVHWLINQAQESVQYRPSVNYEPQSGSVRYEPRYNISYA